MVWQQGDTLYGENGVGHVAVVEDIIDKDTVLTSESAYEGFIFANMIRNYEDGCWGIPNYSYRGCIVNPSVEIFYKKYTK